MERKRQRQKLLLLSCCLLMLTVGCSKGEESDIVVESSGEIGVNSNSGKTLSTTKEKSSNADWFEWQMSSENLNTLREMKLVGSYSDYWNVYEDEAGAYKVLVNDELVELVSDDGVEWRLDEVPEVMRSDLGSLVSFVDSGEENSKGVLVNGLSTSKNVNVTRVDLSKFKKELNLSAKDEVVLGESGESEVVVYDSSNVVLYCLDEVLELLSKSPVASLEGFEYSLDKEGLSLTVTRNAYYLESFGSINYSCSRPLSLTCELSENLEVFTDNESVELVSGLVSGTNQTFLKPLVDSKGVWVTDDFLEKWLGLWFTTDEEENITSLAFSSRDLIVSSSEKPFRKE